MRTKTTLLLLLVLLLLPAAASHAAAEELLIDDFSAGLSPHWQVKSFAGKTLYTPVTVDGRPALRAEARASASGLVYRKKIDPEKLPILAWSWKIDGVLAKGDATTKKGDDYAARVYVIFPSLLFWRTKAINYIWANKLPKGSRVYNPFTTNAAMIAVESGNALAGRWLEEKRNIREDYESMFHEEPPMIGAVAIMTDTDNTGETAVAYYGAIRLLAGG